jgi:non-specific serine/threonine protein kinase
VGARPRRSAHDDWRVVAWPAGRGARLRLAAAPAPAVAEPPEPGLDQRLIEQLLVSCARALASAAYASGQARRAARLIELVSALNEPDDDVSSEADGEASAAQTTMPLTPREQEVAGLVARGLTNRQIGQLLVISERTADTHVSNILNKLGLASRAQVAAWVVEHRRDG